MPQPDADFPPRHQTMHDHPKAGRPEVGPAFLFDLDGTLVDSVGVLLAARRARALGVGLLSKGYGEEEIGRAGAYRVYRGPADLFRHLDEVGVRVAE